MEEDDGRDEDTHGVADHRKFATARGGKIVGAFSSSNWLLGGRADVASAAPSAGKDWVTTTRTRTVCHRRIALVP